jgi:hypothetical protein
MNQLMHVDEMEKARKATGGFIPPRKKPRGNLNP